MEITALSSGSSGNCFYIQNSNKSILIDAGISAKKIVSRLASLTLNPASIKGIFITHEHSDHINGADVLARNFNIPIFATKKTSDNCSLCNNELLSIINNNETIKIAGMEIAAFSKPHKAEDPVSFSVFKDKKISVITDAGYASKSIAENVSDSDFLCIEANHDLQMLESGPYPSFLKQWIKSNMGHLSNLQAGLCVLEHASKKLEHVLLSHLSQANNTPETALSTFAGLIKERYDLHPTISVSVREVPTPLFKV